MGKSPDVRWERGGACCSGRENDATSLYFYRARYYSATFQTFVAQDPLGLGGGNANLYTYALNTPTNFTDASGLWTGSIGVVSWQSGYFSIGGSIDLGIHGTACSITVRPLGWEISWPMPAPGGML